jgi:uncharacterized protein
LQNAVIMVDLISPDAGSRFYGALKRTNMNELRLEKIAHELSITTAQVRATAQLISEAATVPFIARYRKEVTGSLDEVAITSIRDRLLQLEELDSRRDAIIKSLTERNLLTDELQSKIAAAETLAILEDIYLPFRPKRRTKATIAREKGLEPLAAIIFDQAGIDLQGEAAKFVDLEKGVESKMRLPVQGTSLPSG